MVIKTVILIFQYEINIIYQWHASTSSKYLVLYIDNMLLDGDVGLSDGNGSLSDVDNGD